jgi:RimJ/RimL family protein N-acetyltransferase
MATQLRTHKGTIVIRPALPEDAAAVRALRLEALAAHPQAYGADYAATQAGPTAEWAERIDRYAQQAEGILSIATTDEGLIGMFGLVRGHWPKTRHSANFWGAYVREAWRGLRVAQALVEGCVDWARAHEIEVVKLTVTTVNTPAIRCYTRCGFAVYGIEPRALCYDGLCYDELLMVKVL